MYVTMNQNNIEVWENEHTKQKIKIQGNRAGIISHFPNHTGTGNKNVQILLAAIPSCHRFVYEIRSHAPYDNG